MYQVGKETKYLQMMHGLPSIKIVQKVASVGNSYCNTLKFLICVVDELQNAIVWVIDFEFLR